jgi:putative membrane protein insertion efficiency factor
MDSPSCGLPGHSVEWPSFQAATPGHVVQSRLARLFPIWNHCESQGGKCRGAKSGQAVAPRSAASPLAKLGGSLGCSHHCASACGGGGPGEIGAGFPWIYRLAHGAWRMSLSKLAIWMVRGYQRLISRYTPPSCRFYPSCSQYGLQAIRRYGLLRGMVLGSWRILRCNPWSAGGIDPVPAHVGFGCCGSPSTGEGEGGEIG